MSKMYILVHENAPRGCGINSIGHGALACYLKFQKTEEMLFWLSGSFKKVTCKVSEKEWNEAKKAGDYVEIGESSLDNHLMCLAFKPRKNYPDCFSKFKLYI